MAIYKSSFNKQPEKEPKIKVKEKPIKEKPEKVKRKIKVNKALVCLIVFAVLFIVCLPPNFIRSFILGVFGLSIYPICMIGVFFSVMKLRNKNYKVKPKYLTYLTIAVVLVWFIFHLILTGRIPYNSYGQFLADSYHAKTTAGGVIFSLISYPFVKAVTIVGAYIFSFILLAIFVGLIVDYILVEKHLKPAKSKFNFREIESFDEKPVAPKIEQPKIDKEAQQKEIARQKLGLSESTILSSNMPNLDVSNMQPVKPISKREYILTPLEPVIPPEETDEVFKDNLPKLDDDQDGQIKLRPWQLNGHYNIDIKKEEDIPAAKPTQPIEAILPEEEELKEDIFEDNSEDYSELNSVTDVETTDDTDNEQDVLNENLQNDFENEQNEENYLENEQSDVENDEILSENEQDYSDLADLSGTSSATAEAKFEEITPNIKLTDYVDEYGYEQNENLGSTVETEVVRPSVDISKFHLPNQVKKPVVEQVKLDEIAPKEEIPPYVAPPVELLNFMERTSPISEEKLQDNITRLEQVLEDFKVPAKVNNVQVGPAVTRYELTMPRGISVNKIVQMSDDIAMTLASNGAIRVEAPIPGKNAVGIEVPNDTVSPVSLRELVDSDEFRVRANPLSFVLGKDINGDIIFCNLDKMPHLLVAGSTGSGKSVCLNTMLLSMCYKAGPQDLRLILVDPKMVEFTTYNGLPHLLIPEVITNKDMTINALDWAIKEMERRYALFAKNHVVNINEFNKSDAVRLKREEKLPFIVIVVDELADLMLEAKREIEDRIAKLAAKARAAGIHLILATQRPSVDVITGTVKTNLPSRIAFALTNYMDSKTVLDGGGAEKLLGKGDMLFKPQDKPEPRRVQGAFVSNAEISKVVEFIKDHNKPVYDDATGKAIKNPYQDKSGGNSGEGGMDSQEFDPVLKDALYMFIQNKQASGSMISRRYSVGFNRAGRIMDQMERAGFIGPQEGSKPRQVLITMDEYNAIFGDKDN